MDLAASDPVAAFNYRDGSLQAGAVPLAEIARAVGTPTYVYDAGAIRSRYRALAGALDGLPATICYAVKANHNLAVLRLLAGLGAGADTVSGGEIERALAAGMRPERIVFAGLAKTPAEMALALAAGIAQFNVESLDELRQLSGMADGQGRRAPVALRVNPDVAAGGHDKISTGRKGDKFGLPLAEIPEIAACAADLPGIELVGLHVHIGSQIGDLAAFAAAYGRMAELYRLLRSRGLPLRRLDLGGGMGVRYGGEPGFDLAGYGSMLRRVLDGLEADIILEPGRWLVAEAGLLLTAVIATKESDGRRFLILDAGMHNLLRPALYGARHPVLPVAGPAAATAPYDLVGPICESSDIFGRDYGLPALGPGDLLAILDAGAYGAVMASDYNTRCSAAEVLVDGGRFAVVRPPRTARDQMRDEAVPPWLCPSVDPSPTC